MLRVFGKINVFVDEKTIGGKAVKVFSTNIDTEQADKTKVKGYLDVRFSKSLFPEERIANMKPNKCYTLDITDGWLSVRQYQKGDETRKAFYIFVNKANAVAVKDCKPKAETTGDGNNGDLPF